MLTLHNTSSLIPSKLAKFLLLFKNNPLTIEVKGFVNVFAIILLVQLHHRNAC